MRSETYQLVAEYFFEKKRSFLCQKWKKLCEYGFIGRWLYATITSEKRIRRFVEFYLDLKKVDWNLMPEHISGKVLDVACHIPIDGYWISQLNTVDSVTLVDMTPPTGLPIHKVSFSKSDATKLPFADNSFDFVMSFSSIEHLTNRKGQGEWIKEMTRVVKPGGVVSITVDNAFSLFNGFFLYWLIKNRQMLPLFWRDLKKMIVESGDVSIEKKDSRGIYLYTSWMRPWSESVFSYWLEKMVRPLSGKIPMLDARIGFRYRKAVDAKVHYK